MHYIYMLRCRDDSIYTGIASELENRLKIHFEGGAGCSKYVSSRGALRLECYWICETVSEAAKLEYRLKKLPRKSKEMLVSGDSELEDFLGQKLECRVYSRGDMQKAELAGYLGSV
ncbi:MAG: GIY-YIG nuclease family protein [Bacillota bacterium]|nr:GIY-YIG nuclease family protein [Bacillota bacterium]